MSPISIALIVLGISTLSMLVVFSRRLSAVALLDVETIARERERKTKERIASARLQRSSDEAVKAIKKAFSPITQSFQSAFKDVSEAATKLEKRFQDERRRAKRPIAADDAEKIRELIAEGDRLYSERQFREAELKFIKVISMDARNVQAYYALANIYFDTEEYDQAKETLDFLLKLKPGDAETFAMRGEVLYHKGNLHEALIEYGKACESKPDEPKYLWRSAEIHIERSEYAEAIEKIDKLLESDPNNPKYLDLLVETGILAGDRKVAQRGYERFKAVNPENQKLEEFEKKIRELE